MTHINPQEMIKAIVAGVGELIDARANTTETNMKAFMRDLVKESEERQNKNLQEVKSELKTDIKALEHKVDKIEQKLDRTIESHESKIAVLEETISRNRSKN